MTNDELFLLENKVTKLIEYTNTTFLSCEFKTMLNQTFDGILKLCHTGRTNGGFTRNELHELLNWGNGLLSVLELFVMTKFLRSKIRELGSDIIQLVADHHARLND